VAAFALGLIGTVFSAVSLVWTASHRVYRQRPKLVPVIAFQREGNLSTMPATADSAELVAATLTSEDPILVGVEVINCGRLPLHVSGWFWAHQPTGRSSLPRHTIGESIPCDIEPGATVTFLSAPSVFPSPDGDGILSPVYPYFVSNGRKFSAKPFAAEVVALLIDAPDRSKAPADQHD
jgi:hypothetical protein